MSQSRATGLPSVSRLGKRAYRLGPAGLRGNPNRLPLKSLILFILSQHMPDALGQLFRYNSSGHRSTASTFNLSIEFLHNLIVGVGGNSGLPESRPQVFITIFISRLMPSIPATVFGPRYQPTVARKLLRRGESVNVSNLSQDRPGTYFA